MPKALQPIPCLSSPVRSVILAVCQKRGPCCCLVARSSCSMACATLMHFSRQWHGPQACWLRFSCLQPSIWYCVLANQGWLLLPTALTSLRQGLRPSASQPCRHSAPRCRPPVFSIPMHPPRRASCAPMTSIMVCVILAVLAAL